MLFVMCIILSIVFLPYVCNFFAKEKKYDQSEFASEIALLKVKKTDSTHQPKNFYESETSFNDGSAIPATRYEALPHEEFYFDPNTASVAEWKRLGLREKTIHTINNYIAKGGKFYKTEDLAKIWGLSQSDKKRLLPYVRIATGRPATATEAKERVNYTAEKIRTTKALQPIDINLSDTNAYMSLSGIGSKLSKRIIAFREKLGGFYSVEQVGETFLLPDSTFQKIKKQLLPGNAPVKKININSASVDEMKSHPYLRFNIANAIFQYRQQHGPYEKVEDIKKIMVVTDDVFTKAAPYLSIE